MSYKFFIDSIELSDSYLVCDPTEFIVMKGQNKEDNLFVCEDKEFGIFVVGHSMEEVKNGVSM
jgi:hypothetical protein